MTTTAIAAAKNLLAKDNDIYLAEGEYISNPSFENYGKKVAACNARILAVSILTLALNRRFETLDEALEVAQEVACIEA